MRRRGPGGGGRGGSSFWTAMNSWCIELASELIREMGWADRPKWRAIGRFHIHHDVTANISVLRSSWTYKNLLSKSQKSRGGGDIMVWNHWEACHTGATWLQKHSAWRESSEASLHCSHKLESVIWHCIRLHLVGNAFLKTRHMKCLILLGTRICQTPF